jgi:LMBR1 domain-containing protein 1
MILFIFSVLPFAIVYYFSYNASEEKENLSFFKQMIQSFSMKGVMKKIGCSILISIPISFVFYALLILFYFFTRNIEIPFKTLTSNSKEIFTLNEAISCIDCKATVQNEVMTIEWISFVPIFLSILCFIGWFFIFIFAGIGLFSLPFHLIFKIFNRKKRMTIDQYKQKRQEIMLKTLKLMEIGKELKNLQENGELKFFSKESKKFIEFKMSVEKVEHQWKEIEYQFKHGGSSILFNIFCFIFGIISMILSISIIVQISTNNLNPFGKILLPLTLKLEI